MRKLGIVIGALCITLLGTASALAQDSVIPPGDDNVSPDVIVRAPGGTAFTGSEVTVWMVLALGLLVVGVALLITARRRARAAHNS